MFSHYFGHVIYAAKTNIPRHVSKYSKTFDSPIVILTKTMQETLKPEINFLKRKLALKKKYYQRRYFLYNKHFSIFLCNEILSTYFCFSSFFSFFLWYLPIYISSLTGSWNKNCRQRIYFAKNFGVFFSLILYLVCLFIFKVLSMWLICVSSSQYLRRSSQHKQGQIISATLC